MYVFFFFFFFFFQAEDGIRDDLVTGVQTCALPICDEHGPIALIDDLMPVVFIAPKDAVHQKVISNIEEVKARGGRVIAIVTEGDTALDNLADHRIEIPETLDLLTPVMSVVPLQLLAYYIAVRRGCNVDQPRNLAKSVTVE